MGRFLHHREKEQEAEPPGLGAGTIESQDPIQRCLGYHPEPQELHPFRRHWFGSRFLGRDPSSNSPLLPNPSLTLKAEEESCHKPRRQ